MKKNRIANIVMVAMIVAIVAAGVLGVGYIQGWFDADDGTQAVLQEMRGVIHLEREGVSYPAEHQTVLRSGDTVTCNPGATAVIQIGSSKLIIGQEASLTISEPSVRGFAADIVSGEVFANCEDAAVLTFAGKEVRLFQATALISIRSGAQSVSVLRGTVENASAGQVLNFIGDKQTISNLDIRSLNDFAITQIRSVGSSYSLCFTSEDLDRLVADRQAAMQELIDSQTKPTAPESDTSDPTVDVTVPSGDGNNDMPSSGQEESSQPTKPADSGNVTESTNPPATEATVPVTTPPPETTAPTTGGSTCTITIRCDTILNHMDNLKPGKAEFVPSDGVILYPVTVSFEDGETVFDVLKRVCTMTGIQLEYSWTPLYNSYYVEGINNLYAFDCGTESGWMYKVNGWFPNYGCSSYTLEDGDVIVWAYTCQGLGTDVGAPEWEN